MGEKAEFEKDKTNAFYDIEVVSKKKIYDVRVDAQSGAILTSSPDMTEYYSDNND